MGRPAKSRPMEPLSVGTTKSCLSPSGTPRTAPAASRCGTTPARPSTRAPSASTPADTRPRDTDQTSTAAAADRALVPAPTPPSRREGHTTNPPAQRRPPENQSLLHYKVPHPMPTSHHISPLGGTWWISPALARIRFRLPLRSRSGRCLPPRLRHPKTQARDLRQKLRLYYLPVPLPSETTNFPRLMPTLVLRAALISPHNRKGAAGWLRPDDSCMKMFGPKTQKARPGGCALNFSLYSQNIKLEGAKRTFFEVYICRDISGLAERGDV
jgi:hypothetical protein